MDTYICIYINENCINKVHIYEKSINIDEVDIKIIVLSNKESYGNKSSYKYFIGYIYIYIYICVRVMLLYHHYAENFDK